VTLKVANSPRRQGATECKNLETAPEWKGDRKKAGVSAKTGEEGYMTNRIEKGNIF
jgi:hypothetical protein